MALVLFLACEDGMHDACIKVDAPECCECICVCHGRRVADGEETS